MNIVKIVFRVIFTAIFAPFSLPILYLMFTLMGGTIVFIPIFSLYVLYDWLVYDNVMRKDHTQALVFCLKSLVSPFWFWHEFIIGNNPLKQL